eukprot:1080776_1
MHSKAFKYFVGSDLQDMNIVGGAFAIQDGARKFRSGTFNDATTKFHQGGREMNALEIKCLNVALDNWENGIQNTNVSELVDENEENDNFLLIKQTMESADDDDNTLDDNAAKDKEESQTPALQEWLVNICGVVHGSKYYQTFSRYGVDTFEDIAREIGDPNDLKEAGICFKHRIAIWKAIQNTKVSQIADQNHENDNSLSIEQEIEPLFKSNDNEDEKASEMPCRFFGSELGCRFGDRCHYSHDEPNSVPMCRDFTSSGKCYYRRKCHYSHDEPNSVPMCRDFTSSGKCYYRRKCHYRHQDHDKMNQDVISDRIILDNNAHIRVCKFFNETGGCRRGVNCKFRHNIKKKKIHVSQGGGDKNDKGDVVEDID